MRVRPTRAVTGVLLVMVLAVALGAAAYVGGLRAGAPTVVVAAGASPSALVAAGASPPAPTPTPVVAALNPAAVAAALAAPLADPRLGSHVLAQVLDPATGTVLLDRDSAATTSPASTAKLATSVAILSVRAPTARITTRVVLGSTPGTAILVGGGDPTLSAAAAGTATPYADAARISDLANQVRTWEKTSGQSITAVAIDTSLFTGPAVSPDWDAEDVPSNYGAAITALMVDGGRDTPTATIRSATPAQSAGRALAAALGLPSSATPATVTAPATATQLAAVQSPPLSELVAQALSESDNVIAEMLARQVAIARAAPASFTGSAAAVAAVLTGLGVDITGQLVDGSGLARRDRLSPTQLARLVALCVTGAAPLHEVLTALPVAAWDGTLQDRYVTSSQAGAGVVRAKTGTLTSVSALAGVVSDADGHQLVFAFMADGVGASTADTDAAEAALDSIAAALAGCGCR